MVYSYVSPRRFAKVAKSRHYTFGRDSKDRRRVLIFFGCWICEAIMAAPAKRVQPLSKDYAKDIRDWEERYCSHKTDMITKTCYECDDCYSDGGGARVFRFYERSLKAWRAKERSRRALRQV